MRSIYLSGGIQWETFGSPHFVKLVTFLYASASRLRLFYSILRTIMKAENHLYHFMYKSNQWSRIFKKSFENVVNPTYMTLCTDISFFSKKKRKQEKIQTKFPTLIKRVFLNEYVQWKRNTPTAQSLLCYKCNQNMLCVQFQIACSWESCNFKMLNVSSFEAYK